jgi:predicted O-methyltransferase YrrM
MNIDAYIKEKFNVVDNVDLPLRCDCNRNHLLFLFLDLEYKIGAEVGVERGKYSLLMCQVIPNLKLFCVDPWKQPGKNTYQEALYQKILKRLSPYNVEILRMTSVEASKIIPDGSLDFVYIDALHYFDDVWEDINLWEPKVRNGGIVAGHDYVNVKGEIGVEDAVKKFVQERNINPYYITLYDVSEGWPSWFWVKR